jgi:hypothetical protein
MQSLAMLNDPQIIEAARNVAIRMMNEGGTKRQTQLSWGFRLITGRFPNKKENALLDEMYLSELKNFEKNPGKASDYLSVGRSCADVANPNELAALSNTALALMNTDEFLTRK